jgi:lipoprotein-anchoring transpeptidase ErfK/SrfK
MLNRRRFVLSSAVMVGGAALWPLAATAKTPPRHTSTTGTAVDKPPTQLKPGEYVWHPEIAPRGPIVMVVSLSEQLAYVYRNGVLIGASTVSTGKKGHETPTGVFTILQKHADHYSSIYDSAPMPYMQRLTWSGVALHAGRLPGYPASHGCVRMPYDFAQLLYAESSMGVTVVVSDEKKFPSTVAHPGLFTPVDLTGATAAETAAAESYVWEPEKSAEGPVTILVTGEDRRVRVFRGGAQIGWATYSLDDPSRRLPFVVLTRLEEPAYDPNAAFASRTSLPLWSVVSGAPETTVSADRLLNGVRGPAEFLQQLMSVVVPGTTLVLTQLPASGQTTGVDMTVVTADPPAAQP